MQQYYTDKTKKRLNKQGRALFGVQHLLAGKTEEQVATILNIPVERINKLYGAVAGLLGLFDEHPEGTSGKKALGLDTNISHTNIEKRMVYISRIDMLIAKKGERLFTEDPLPRQKNK
ncbi:hypothetical protein [Vibrio phage RYC]|nr:hypothetical protein [Vibrio phage RYC]